MNIEQPLVDKLLYLHSRWEDEKAYESFEGYQEAIKRILPEGVTEFKMTQKFVVTWKLEEPDNADCHYHKLWVSGKQVKHQVSPIPWK